MRAFVMRIDGRGQGEVIGGVHGPAHLAAHAAGGAEHADARHTSAPANEEGGTGPRTVRVICSDSTRWAMRRASSLYPQDAFVHNNLAMVLQGLGREEDAAREYEAAVASLPPLAQPRISLAEILMKRGDRARARALLDEASRLEVDREEVEAIVALQQQLDAP